MKDGYNTSSYLKGLSWSLALTLIAYILVTKATFSRNTLLLLVGFLAVMQFLVQAVYFLHLTGETKPRWKRLMFVSMLGVVLVIVFGSLWIMQNLNYHHPDPTKSSDSYIIHDEGELQSH